jgi:flagellar hook-basal body complex protein FliE
MQTDPLVSAGKALISSLPKAPETGIIERGIGAANINGRPIPVAEPFSGVLKDVMSNLQGLEQQASSTVEGLVSGRGVDVHAAMIATEKSDQAFEMALAVRGKMVSAYQTMMGVQF